MIDGATHFVGRSIAAAGVLAAALLAAIAAHGANYDVGPMHIEEPWARATPKGASTGAGYLTVTSAATAPDRLICVSTNAAAKCEIHSMTSEGGVMKMRPVEGGVEIKPGETVTLKPGALHMMFVDLKHPLEPGKTVAVTLKFEKAGTVKIELPILPFGARAPNTATGGTMGGSMMQGGTMMMQGGGSMQHTDK